VRIAAVSGTCSRAGKTALAESLLRAVPRGAAAAVKFTTTEDVFERCPRGSSCVVCDIEVPFRVIVDPAVLGEPGTDTARLAAAGASRVIWAIARETAASEAWAAVAAMLGNGLVVLEGSSVVARRLARPDLALFVAHRAVPPERWKPTSDALITAADRVLVHSESGSAAPAVLAGLEARGGAGKTAVADVTRPLAEWAPDLAGRVAALAQTLAGAAR
jgi:molybdopterin-guanine dinucleotide biosynthesis protein